MTDEATAGRPFDVNPVVETRELRRTVKVRTAEFDLDKYQVEEAIRRYVASNLNEVEAAEFRVETIRPDIDWRNEDYEGFTVSLVSKEQ